MPERPRLVLHSDKHDRDYDFSFLGPFGDEFSFLLATELLRVLEKGYARSSADGLFGTGRKALRWVASHRKRFPGLFKATLASLPIPPDSWQEALDAWVDSYSDSTTIGRGTLGGEIVRINTLLGKLTRVLPRIEPLVVPRDYRAALGRRKTVGEVPRPAAEPTPAPPQGVEETLSVLAPIHRRTTAALAAISAVMEELGPVPTAEQLEHALKALPAARLQEIRSKAESHVLEAYERFQLGERLIKARESDSNLIFAAYDAEWGRRDAGEYRNDRRPIASRVLPYVTHTSGGEPLSEEDRLGNLLVFLDRKLGGYTPAQVQHDAFYHAHITPRGGAEYVQSHLTADIYVLTAALAVILIDCHWNPSTGLRLKTDCIRKSQRAGHFEIVGFKPRSNSPQHATLQSKALPPRKVTSKQIVEIIGAMTRRPRAIADAETAKRLFIYRFRNETRDGRPVIVLGEADGPHKCFKRLQAKWGWANAPYTLDQFRSTGAVTEAVTAGGLARVQNALGHTSLRPTGGYLEHLPVELHWEALMRGYQNDIMMIPLQSIEGAAQQLGVTTEDFVARVQLALRNGRGLFCADPYAGVHPASREGELCTEVQDCWKCRQRFFVATVENTADLVLWYRHLEAGADLKYSHPHQWYEQWAPWWVLTEVLLEKVRSDLPDVLEDATNLADERQASGSVHFRHLA